MIALDADTGKLKWYFQFSPHEDHDWDSDEPASCLTRRSTEAASCSDLPIATAFITCSIGRMGNSSRGARSLKQTSAKGLDANGGGGSPRPTRAERGRGNAGLSEVTGGVDWTSPSYSPDTGFFYVSAHETGAYFIKGTGKIEPGPPKGIVGGGGIRALAGASSRTVRFARRSHDGEAAMAVQAAGTGVGAGALTAGGLVFSGSEGGDFFALDAG